MSVPDNRVGTKVRCPKCGEPVLIAQPALDPPPVTIASSRSAASIEPASMVVPPPPPPRVPPSLIPPAATVSTPLHKTQVASAGSAARGAEHSPPLRGLEYDHRTMATVRQLAAAVALVALFGAIPAMLEIPPAVRRGALGTAAHWAYLLLFVGALQCAYAAYLAQLPDWGTLWVVTLVTLAVAMTYALFFGLTLLASDQSHLIQLLDLGDRLRDGKARIWCLCMLILTSLLAYFCGRVCVRWHRDFAAAYPG